MEKSIVTVDYSRVIAVFMILLCHYFLFSNLNTGIGRYLAGTGNMIFFLVSALLYGTKYSNNSQRIDYKSFVIGRVTKLGASLWPYLTIVIILYMVFKIKFSWIDVGLNYLFLGYLGKLPGNGHLWFITVLVACYAVMLLYLRFRVNNRSLPWILLILSVVVVFIGEYIGVPSGAFLILGFFSLVFLKSGWYMEKSKSMTWWMIVVIVLFNVFCFVAEYKGLFEYSRSLHFVLTGLCGISLLSLMLRCLPQKSNRTISYLCGISFEIYLVHHTLCAGPFIYFTKISQYHAMNFCLMVFLSFVMAIMLKTIANFSLKCVLNKNN